MSVWVGQRLLWANLCQRLYSQSYPYPTAIPEPLLDFVMVQPVDLTTLYAACGELSRQWIPAKVEQIYQCDRFTIQLALRTLQGRGWLTLSWHPQAARMHIGDAPPRSPDTFTFSEQLRHQLNGLALISLQPLSAWERVIDLQFAQRPQEPPLWHLYVEVMGKYSNVILTTADHTIVTAAHQVNVQQSRVRPILTGSQYDAPPTLIAPTPTLAESQSHWQERLTLIPGSIRSSFLKTYRGLSSALVGQMVESVGVDPEQPNHALSASQWQQLFTAWQTWLKALASETFSPGWRSSGYSVMGWGITVPVTDIQTLLNRYYTQTLNLQRFQALQQQLQRVVQQALQRLQTKAESFEQHLAEAKESDQLRQQADLLMAYLQEWFPGMKTITLLDFVTESPMEIPLNPEWTAVQNAQTLYKRHQKLKRSIAHTLPLLQSVQQDISYLEQVAVSIQHSDRYDSEEDIATLNEIRSELMQQQYLKSTDPKVISKSEAAEFHRFFTPNGWEVLVGRNNRQNEHLSFRLSTDYDLWFHTQEIPGSHVLLRLAAGTKPDTQDLQCAANLAAYYSRARQSHQVPVVYTRPKHVYKPKGAKPGMVVYKHETILWADPQRALSHLAEAPQFRGH
jgi:predicted ribosome quality control (RQC) complex YloA/Tae2 family protein